MKPSAVTKEPSSFAERPSDKARSFISLALFIHLFAISVAMIANSAIVPSQLLSTVRGTVLRYLYLTWTDVGFDYSYLGSELDMQHKLVADFRRGDGSIESRPVEPEGLTGIRHDRYVRLARNVAARLQNPDQEGLLPSMIGGGLLRRTQSESSDVIIRCELHPPVDFLAYRSGARNPPPAETLYQARVRLVDSQARIVEKFDSRGQVAPDAWLQSGTGSPGSNSQTTGAVRPSSPNPQNPVLPPPRSPIQPFQVPFNN